ncbi:pirin family protein [Luteococcus sp. Sow4_B9]|uniref:pirin family protein n=1 Tax=Luteococcus sp. Sow4_B9 TaxID=3438792 RepID=UPI003F94A703
MPSATRIVIDTFDLASPWPGSDPFLFAVYHRDTYPPAKADTMTPDAPLDGRDLGQDFAGKDGWNMYHGRTVPGFPQHPHRGFETVTVVTRGFVDHTDSLGAQARYGQGDTQWLTTGRGVAHSEMFPLLRDDADNPLELFQIWLNLGPEDKTAEPHFSMFWAEETPFAHRVDDTGRRTDVRVVAGAFDEVVPLDPPPHSWAARPENGVAIWLVQMEPGATVELPAATVPGTTRTLYPYDGTVIIDDERYAGTGIVADPSVRARLTAGEQGANIVVLQGRPIGAPVVQYGPFVANSQQELQQAFADYRSGAFGRWREQSDDPVLPRETGRMARHPDGMVVNPPSQ